MIIKINILPADRIPKEERTEYLIAGYAFFALLVVIALSHYAVISHSYNKLHARMEIAEGQLKSFQTIVNKVDILQSTKIALETKSILINSLLTGGVLYPRFMESLAKRTPQGIEIQSLNTVSRGDGGIDAVLLAVALDNYSIADFISTLMSDPDFSLIELGAISSTGGSLSPGATFRLTFSYNRKKT